MPGNRFAMETCRSPYTQELKKKVALVNNDEEWRIGL